MNDLELYREELANCDAKITEALKERYAIIEKIMAYKEEYGMPILQPEQEEKQKKRLMFSLHNDKHRDEIYDVFERIQRNSKKIQARKLFDYNIVLIGFMGAGKSTISDYLSTMFAMEVVEMDQLIAEREGMSISDIFETYGEEYFRNMETNLLIEMQEKKNVIISCGGGVAMRERNVAEMKKNGRVVLLTAHPQTILDRVKDSVEQLAQDTNTRLVVEAKKSREYTDSRTTVGVKSDGTLTSADGATKTIAVNDGLVALSGRTDSVDRRVTKNTQAIQSNTRQLQEHNARLNSQQRQIRENHEEMKRAAAQSAALAGLFQPYSVGKFNATAALGGYSDKQAVAVGVGYRFNEQTAAKAGIAASDGDVSYNMGVNFEF